MVDPGTKQKVGASENMDVVLEQIEGFDPSMLARVVSRREAGG